MERTLIRPPSSQLGPITSAERADLMAMSEMAARYDKAVDRQSAFEILQARAEKAATEAAAAEEAAEEASAAVREFNAGRRYSGGRVARSTSRRTRRTQDTLGSAVATAVLKELKGTTGRRIVRGILGGLFKGR